MSRDDTARALKDLATERHRQIVEKGYTPSLDDRHALGELAQAAMCYAAHAGYYGHLPNYPTDQECAPIWPWSPVLWKPRSPREDLVRAGALILAELERLDRRDRKASQ